MVQIKETTNNDNNSSKMELEELEKERQNREGNNFKTHLLMRIKKLRSSYQKVILSIQYMLSE